VTKLSCTWIELAIILKLQTGYELAGRGADLITQADAMKKMVKQVWSKTVHKVNGLCVTAKVFWRPAVHARSTQCVTGIKLAGLLRRPILDEQTWAQALLNLTLAKSQAGDTKEFAREYVVRTKARLVRMPKNTALEVLAKLHQAEDEHVEHRQQEKKPTRNASMGGWCHSLFLWSHRNFCQGERPRCMAQKSLADFLA
jgi:hypothetical protein